MKRVLLVIAALLSLTVLLAACKKSGDTISTPTAESTPATVEATPAPTELPPYEANVLTGEPKGADYPEGQRITAVMVNNIVAARPQRGLSKADILFEIKVVGGIYIYGVEHRFPGPAGGTGDSAFDSGPWRRNVPGRGKAPYHQEKGGGRRRGIGPGNGHPGTFGLEGSIGDFP